MADTKASLLTALAGADVAGDDVLYVVDVSEVGVARSKSLTILDLFLGLHLDSVATLADNNFSDTQTITQGTANLPILTSTGYSVTGANEPVMVSLVGTWNTSGAPVALKIALSNTASGAGSKFASFLAGAAGATEVFAVTKAGQTRAGDGTEALPGLSFVNDPDTGFYERTANRLSASVGGTLMLELLGDRLAMNGTGVIGFCYANTIAGIVPIAGITSTGAKVIGINDGSTANVANGWLQWAGQGRLTADATKANTTFGNLTDLTLTVQAARKYIGTMRVVCNNSTAAEGIKFDFNGGTATMTSFAAAAIAQGATAPVIGAVSSTSLAGVINYTTITGETVIEFSISFVSNGAGTVIPRFAENSTAVGTATVELGGFIMLHDSPV